jgi:hypothetical protein
LPSAETLCKKDRGSWGSWFCISVRRIEEAFVQIDDLNVQNETVSIPDHGMVGSEGDEVVSDWIFIQSETEKYYSSEQYKN